MKKNTRDYGKVAYEEGGPVVDSDDTPNEGASQLTDIRDKRVGTSRHGPEAQAFGIDKLERKRNDYNKWFQTPGMDAAGASGLRVGPKTDA